jgi:hypothetical protein
VPANVTSATFTIIGGGGGAGGSNGYGGGSSGLSGKAIKVTLPVTPGTTFPIVVGKGGGLGNAADAGVGNCGSDAYYYFVGLNSAQGSGLGGLGYTNGTSGSYGAGCLWSFTPSQGFGGGGGGSTAFSTGTTTLVAAGGDGGIGAAGSHYIVVSNMGLGGVGAGAPTTTPVSGLGKGGVANRGNDGGVIVDYFVVTGVATSTPDITAPTLALVGPTTTSVVLGSNYVDQGAIAVDNIDGNITARVVASSTVNTAALGTYSVVYSVSDLAGNTAIPVSRTVTVVPAVSVDTVPPVLTLVGPLMVSIQQGSVYTDPGATASDAVDGNLTGSITATSTVNSAVPGIYFVTYHVSDRAGNQATPLVRIVEVKALDMVPPVIGLRGAGTVFVNEGGVYTELGATAVDAVDGDISNRVVISGTASTTVPGVYTLIYSVADAAGNIATPATRTVTVVPTDTVPPTITLIGSSTISILQGGVYVDQGATAQDNIDGNITAQIRSVSTVNTAQPGNYFVSYSVSDSAGNSAFVSRLVVVITPALGDTVPPILNIIGSSTVSLLVNTPYADAGAFAFDAVDGNITSRIVSSSTVDVSTPGAYSVLYSVTDLAGNSATTSRAVVVLAAPDVSPPTTPSISFGSPLPGVATANGTVSMIWSQSTDTGSGTFLHVENDHMESVARVDNRCCSLLVG